MHKSRLIAIHSSPLALGIVLSFLFWKHNLLMLAVYAALVLLVIVSGKDKKVETWIFVYGLIAGVVIEVIGTGVSGYQSFARPDAWGIPFWLPISWGYGFILMKRVGLVIATGSPWTPAK